MTTPAEKPNKTIGTARIVYETPFRACVEYLFDEMDIISRERDVIQLFGLSTARLLFLLGENKQAGMLLGYLQQAMADTVNPKGLFRPSILGKDQILLPANPEKSERNVVLKLIQEEDGRLAELVLPLGNEGHLYPATVVFFLQYLIKTLGEPSLFFLMLVLAGMMEYYEKIGKTNDLKAITDAPAYGFSEAMRYIDEERKRAQMPPA